LNVGLFTESALTWSIEIVGLLLEELLTFQQFPTVSLPTFSRLELREREACGALAQVGRYPVRTDAPGIPARTSLHQSVMGSLYRAQQRVGQ
jgi:hypothetical protein